MTINTVALMIQNDSVDGHFTQFTAVSHRDVYVPNRSNTTVLIVDVTNSLVTS